ncbi:MAG: N-succinylarginine dihydrolase [Acidobacteriia bacterium]|nr:N-succinylarginine dihydrolase [Terriglobia bacterium]
MATTEISFEGIPGPSHSFGGLAYGDFAAMASAGKKSNPRMAAKQCIQKMRLLVERGVPVVILPPHERPALWFLRSIGYCGADSQILQTIAKSATWLLPVIYSSSGMWCANAATVVPSVDASDGLCHVVVANLAANLHRSLEPQFVLKALQQILPESAGFDVQPGIPGNVNLWDEGAANHLRISQDGAGLHVFMYGRKAGKSFARLLQHRHHILGRQTDEASLAVARLGHLPSDRILLAQQNQGVIDQGVFHNDVICMSAGMTLIVHEQAVRGWPQFRRELQRRTAVLNLGGLNVIELLDKEISVKECVRTYFFNSQLVQLPNHKLLMICPAGCQRSKQAVVAMRKVQSTLGSALNTEFIDLSESLANGGGPACLRLRMRVTDKQLQAVSERAFIASIELLDRLEATVDRRYREALTLAEFRDPVFAQECLRTLDEVAGLLGYGSIYAFQS